MFTATVAIIFCIFNAKANVWVWSGEFQFDYFVILEEIATCKSGLAALQVLQLYREATNNHRANAAQSFSLSKLHSKPRS